MTEKQITKLLKGQQLSYKALVEKVEAYTAQEKSELDDLLNHLQENGVVGKGATFYYLLKDQGVFLAKIIVKNRNFVILKSIPDGEEIRISGEEADQLLLGDLVYAKEFQQNTFHCVDYYKAVAVLKGRYSLTKSGKEQLLVDYLNECGKTIIIKDVSEGLSINQGDLVEAKIVAFEGDTITVNVTNLLVHADEVGSDISIIISSNDGRLEFPHSVTEEAKNIPQQLSESDYNNRTDFRNDTVVTIDGDDAHDFDDAVEARRDGKGYIITVHIADVTHYVRPHHPLDDEALARGTSIYVADRVVPMLPFELSNGICSLNPEVDRLTLSVIMSVDAMGYVYNTKIVRGVIRSHGRLTYKQVNDYFEGKDVGFSKEIMDTLDILKEAHKVIRRRRTLQGAMRLDSTELKFKLDENGTPTDVVKMTQGESEELIEDMMIIANCSVAKELRDHKIPVLYRVHEFPPMEKLSTFRDYLKRMSLLKEFPKNEYITGARLNDFLASIKDENVHSAVSYMMLRTMSKARYCPEEIGHFGLAELEYCHFTSPIRRYPDDIIHRLVKDYLIDEKTFDYNDVYSYLEMRGEDMSSLEVKADHIQREVEDLEAAKYMANHIGEIYHGRVVSMVQRGMFIETELGIEGFLAYHCMHGDYFKYNENAFAVFGKMTDISFTIGTEIDIKVLAANPKKGEIDFATPEFYDDHAFDLSEEERERLSLDGLQVVNDYDDYQPMTGKARFSREDKEYGEKETMDNENKDIEIENTTNNDVENEEDNLSVAMENLEKVDEETSDFRPSPEQWKEVDVIRAVMAKYPDDEAKVIAVLGVMDISEEEYRKLLRFTKPREDRHSSRGGRGSDRGDRRGGDRRGGRSFGGRGGDRGGFRRERSGDGERRGFRGDRDSHSDRGGRGGDRGGFRRERSGDGESRGFRSDRGGYGSRRSSGPTMSNRSERRAGRGDSRDRAPKRSLSDHKGYAGYSGSESRGRGSDRGSSSEKKSYGARGKSRAGYGKKRED